MARGDPTFDHNDSHEGFGKHQDFVDLEFNHFDPSSQSAKPGGTSKPRSGQLIKKDTTRRSENPTAQRDETHTCCRDIPRQIANNETAREAMARIDASARNGRPFAVITFDEDGTSQTIHSKDVSPQMRRQIRMEETMLAKQKGINSQGALILRTLEAQSPLVTSSDRTSRSSSSTTTSITQSVPSTRFIHSIGSKKRGASTPLSRSASPIEESHEPARVVEVRTIHLQIGSKVALDEFYTRSFGLCQQLALKQLGKTWVKEIEPFKQRKFPYSGGKEPKWWPEVSVYREPDHVKKGDREKLLVRILHLVTGLEVLEDYLYKGTVDNLMKVTFDKTQLAFPKDSAEKVERRKQILRQIFSVARREADFVRGERDGTTGMTVTDYSVVSHPKPRKPRARRPSKRQKASQEGTSGISRLARQTSKDPLSVPSSVEPANDEEEPEDCAKIQHLIPDSKYQISEPEPARSSPDLSYLSQQWPSLATRHNEEVSQPAYDFPSTSVQGYGSSVSRQCNDMQQQALQYHIPNSRYSSFESNTAIDYTYATNTPITPVSAPRMLQQDPMTRRQDLANTSFGSTRTTVADPNEWEVIHHPASMAMQQVPMSGLTVPMADVDVAMAQHVQQPQMVYSAVEYQSHHWQTTPAAYPHQTNYSHP